MMVLTVEFTRIPLSRRGEAALELQTPPTSSFLDARTVLEVTESAALLAGYTSTSRPDVQLLRLYSDGD
jgi:hypothetical protein